MSARFLATALIVIGTILLMTGVNAWNSLSSDISRAAGDAANLKSIVLISAGVLMIFLGSTRICRCK